MINNYRECQSKAEQFDSSGKSVVDQLESRDSIFYLRASKGQSGEICLKYRLNHKGSYRDFCFKYFDYSDAVFPDTSIGITNGRLHDKSNYVLLSDSILLLPVIGMNNSLSVYILNLQSQQVIGDDIRTSLDLVWVDKKSSTFIVADTRSYVNDTTYLYRLNKYKVNGNTLSIVKKDTAHLDVKLEDDFKAGYRVVKRIQLDGDETDGF